MPNIKSAKKRMKTNEKARLRNRAVRSAMRTSIKSVDAALATGDAEAVRSALPVALKEIARTAKKGVIHSSTAARKESRLVRRVNAFLAQAQ